MTARTRDRLLWLASFVTFCLGLYIGMRVHARAGAILWGVSAAFALAPFAWHRNKV